MSLLLRALSVSATLLLSSVLGGGADAQDFPTKLVRIVSPAQPGGATDVLARALGEELRRALGQTVIIENRPGAGGNTGSDQVAKSDPDGHTLLLAPAGPLTLNEFLYSKIPFDPATAFAPITMVADMPLVLVVHPKTKVASVKELVALAAKHTTKLSFGLSNVGGANHLALLLFERAAGVSVAHVPYRGAAPVAQDLVAGQIEGAFINPPTVMSQIEERSLLPLAVIADQRLALLPNVPTISEAGIPGVFGSTWFALVAPAATPQPIIARLHAETATALHAPELRERFNKLGATLVGNTPAELGAFLKAERERWRPIVKQLNLRLE